MSFTNVYYKRTTGTPKACYICYKPTTTVLATIDIVDFVYTCPGHLADHGFVSSLGGAGGSKKAELTEEEIVKVKAEWEEKQRKKLEREKEKAKAKEKDEKKSDEDGSKEKRSKSEESKSPKAPESPPQPPTHEQFALHRDFFAMRKSEHRKRKQAAQAQALAPRLPGAPSGSVENKY